MPELKFHERRDKVLVTGAGGFIGSHLVEHLLDLGYDATCLIRPGENLRWLKSLNVSLLTGDLTQKSTLYSCVRGISAVYL
jgi:uncharacterized protein YbjT (DUF2867 family)